jgi:hypothetical protein
MKFIEFSDNYADEFDVLGYALMDEDSFREWNRAMTKATELTNHGYEFEIWFGTNERLVYDKYYLLGESCEVHEIYGPDVYAISKYITKGYNSYVGVFPTIDRLVDFIEACEDEGENHEE